MNPGDILLCNLNEGSDDSICYILHKYSNQHVNKLRLEKRISFDVVTQDSDVQENNSLVGYEFDVEEEVVPEKEKKQYNGYLDPDLLPSSSEEEDENKQNQQRENWDDIDVSSESDIDINAL